MIARAAIVAAARAWIGTPYRHQGTRRGVAADCLGLVRGVWRDLYGSEPESPPPYRPDWAERGGGEGLLAAAERHFRAIGRPATGEALQAGDLVVFRWRPDLPAKHVGILAGPASFVHAYEQVGVIESALVPAWRRRIAGLFVFPGA